MGTDPSRDEVVLMQILQVLRTLMLAPCGSYLTNESVVEILQSCFRICFETRLSELLRKTSEHTLADMIKILFSRLPSFKEDSRSSIRLRMRSSRLKNKSSLKKLANNDGGENSSMGQAKKSNLKRRESASAEDISTRANNTCENLERKTQGETAGDKEKVSSYDSTASRELRDDGGSAGVGEMCTNEGDRTKLLSTSSPVLSNLKKSMSEPDLADEQNLSTLEECCEDDRGAENESEKRVREEFAMVDINEEESIGDQSDSASNVTNGGVGGQQDLSDYVNPRGIRFTQEVHHYEDDVVLIPHGLPCVRELFRFLITLINPYDNHNNEYMIQISLSLLTVALEVASDSIANFSSLLKLAREELCKHLFSLLYHRRFFLVLPSLRLSFLVFESIRTFVKLQMECYLIRIMELMNSDLVALDIKEKAIDFLVKLFKVPGFAAELYINFDCDVYCSNLFEDITKLLSKNAFPVSGLQNYHILSLDALLALIDTVSAHCNHASQSGSNYDSPTHSKIDIVKVKERKRHLETGTDMFNQKPKDGIEYLQNHGFLEKPLDFKEVANHLRENWRLDKKMIGEYISDKRVGQLLTEYISTFNFAQVRLDEALRSFLESFRLPGEAPVISYILEAFSHNWHESNDRPFASDDAVYILAYAIVMLNTDQHNPQAKKQNIPMSLNDFKSQVRGVNGGSDFEPEMIEEIYLAIKSKEIVLPTEQSGPLKENYVWKQLDIRATTGSVMPYIPAHDGAYNLDIFTLVWGSTVAALSFVFDKSMEEKTILKSISGFRKCAQIAAFYGCGDVFDNLVISLCKFTTLVNINAEGPEMVPYYFGCNAKAQLAAKTMFQLAHNQGDTLREGWKNIVDCLQNLFKCKLVPNSMVEVEDFVDPSGKISLTRDESTRMVKNDSSGLLSSFYSYFTGSDVQATRGVSAEDQEALQQAKNCIVECKPDQLISESKFLQEQSLLELVKALRFASQGPEARLGEGVFDQDLAVFNLELLIQVAIQNRDRITLIWSQINRHLCDLITEAKICSFLVQRAVVGLLRLCIRLLHNEIVASDVIQALKVLLFVEHKVMKIACREVAFGLYELIKTNAANIHLSNDWNVVLALLQSAGTGLKFVKFKFISEIDSTLGATKPQTAGSKTREIVDIPCLGQYVIKDKEKQGINDVRAFMKCWQGLVLIVQDTAHVTPYNLEPCATTLKIFAEAASYRKTKKSKIESSGKPQKRVSSSKSKNVSAGGNNKTPSPSESLNMSVMSDEEEESVMVTQIEVISQLLIRIEELHNRAPKMLKSWAAEDVVTSSADSAGVVNSQQKSSSSSIAGFSLWDQCWLPLLLAIGRLCCDSRREVRMDALGRLQRCLLTHEMLCLTSKEWESCFNVVFLPILHQLLESSVNPNDPSGMEETRMRAANTLSKVFLQRLNTLLSLPNFLDLWVDILMCMKKYMHADNSELLAEAIPESLKNILLVMQTARLFDVRSQFTIVTWKTLDEFLPKLQSEILSTTSNVGVVPPMEAQSQKVSSPPSSRLSAVEQSDAIEVIDGSKAEQTIVNETVPESTKCGDGTSTITETSSTTGLRHLDSPELSVPEKEASVTSRQTVGSEVEESSDAEFPSIIIQPPLPETSISMNTKSLEPQLSHSYRDNDDETGHSVTAVAPVVITAQCGDFVETETKRGQELTAE